MSRVRRTHGKDDKCIQNLKTVNGEDQGQYGR